MDLVYRSVYYVQNPKANLVVEAAAIEHDAKVILLRKVKAATRKVMVLRT